VLAVLGIEPEVLSGEEEARLSFTGATTELVGRADAPYLVADIGGGSTEVVLGDLHPGGAGGTAGSRDIARVPVYSKEQRAAPPTAAEIGAARADIDAALDVVEAKIPVAGARTLVGLAGSVTTVAALALGLDSYQADRIHHSRIGVDAVREQTHRLLGQTRAQR